MACGSASSRFARQPMWPLDSAKRDSDLPSWVRSTSVSRTTQGSGSERPPFRITSRLHELGKVLHDDIRSVRAKRVCPAGAVDANHQSEVSGSAGPDAGERVFVDGCVGGKRLQRSGGGKVGVGSGLAAQVLLFGDVAIDLDVEVAVQSRGTQDFGGVFARRDDCDLQSRGSRRADVADGAVVGLDSVAMNEVQKELVLFARDAVDQLRGCLDAAGCQDRPHPVGAGFAVDVGGVVGNDLEGDAELVEGLLPRLGVHFRGLGDDAVQVKEAGLDVGGEAQLTLHSTRTYSRKKTMKGVWKGVGGARGSNWVNINLQVCCRHSEL